jgi:hypothetical protein
LKCPVRSRRPLKILGTVVFTLARTHNRISPSTLWSCSVFFLFSYITFCISLLTYMLPVLNNTQGYTNFKNKSTFFLINWNDISWLIITPYILFLLTNLIWSSSVLSVWFGHITLTLYTSKIIYLILLVFLTVILVLLTTSYFSSKEIYDYFLTLFNFFYWIVLLFLSNSIFTLIFIIEVLSTLIFLLIITSVYSTSFFYKTTNTYKSHFFEQNTPFSYIQSLLFFFWISLISSLNLFLFLIFLFFKCFTLDWYLLEHIFFYLTTVSTIFEIFSIGLVWFIFLFCLFVKCGLAPFFIWKPTFFKGIPLQTLFFYICFFYFFLFVFIINILTSYFSEIFYFYTFIITLFILISIITLFAILCESLYLKVFLAVSSILNSVLVFFSIKFCTCKRSLFFFLKCINGSFKKP